MQRLTTALAGVATLLTMAVGGMSAPWAETPAGQLAPTMQFQVMPPDLRVHQFQFAPTNNKAVRVQVANFGQGGAGPSVLRLTVRRIDGTPVGRTTEVSVPALAPLGTAWLVVDATAILPVAVGLASTTFRLDADATSMLAETDETNNTSWHNL